MTRTPPATGPAAPTGCRGAARTFRARACLARDAPSRALALACGLVLAAAATAGIAAGAAAPPAAPPATPGGEAAPVLRIPLPHAPWTGDFDGMLQRRLIRFAVPYSRTLYFIDAGREFGVGAALIRDFERWVNHKFAPRLGKRPLTVVVIVTTPEELLPKLSAGLADIAAGDLTVTEDRLRRADFIAPRDLRPNVEVLVTGPASPPVATVDDLAGKTVHVRKSSSYFESLTALNARLHAAGRPGAQLAPVPDALNDEDMMEMVGAGLLGAIVVDEWKARIWAEVIPGLRVHGDVVLRSGGRVGWAIRKSSPGLAVELEEFYAGNLRPEGAVPSGHLRQLKTTRMLHSAAAAGDRARFAALEAAFEQYGRAYGFDPLMLAAQGYQESRLDQGKVSPAGAIGIMQLLPATGAALGVGDIRQAEPNIHAGAKYLNQVLTGHFSDARFDERNRALFAFASYNAGPAGIRRMREEARKRGLNPDVWFDNVEVVAAEKIGMETPTYVRNIYKYYVSYSLEAAAREAAARLQGGAPPAR